MMISVERVVLRMESTDVREETALPRVLDVAETSLNRAETSAKSAVLTPMSID